MGKRIFLFINLLSVLLSSVLLASGEGRPLREGTFDLPEMFKNPPNGYGEVPFYWRMGDKLERKHILAHLEELKGKGIQSLQVNYAHSDKGGYFWGLTYRSDPPLMSDEWWDLFAWFKSEANKRGMSVSLSDYTLGLGQGQFLDRALAEDPALRAQVLNEFKAEFKDKLNVKLPCKKPLCAAIYSIASDGKLLSNTRENVSELVDADGFLKLERRGRHILVCVYPQLIEVSYDPTNPDSGKLYIKHFFAEFERRLGGCNGLNFFFSDELDFRIEGRFVWSEYLQSEFKKVKGYDIGNCADLLFVDYPDFSAKIKLDYNDVFVSLYEKNFFKPVYDWHESRGMIYGCDYGSRGKK